MTKEIKTFFSIIKFTIYICKIKNILKKIEKLEIYNPEKINIKTEIEIDKLLMSHIKELTSYEYSDDYIKDGKIDMDKIIKKWSRK